MSQPIGPASTYQLACLISARNLGDAVLHAGFLSTLVGRRFAHRYLVWTKPGAEFLFAHIPDCEIVTSPFPMGTSGSFGWRSGLDLLSAVKRIRRYRPDVTLDLVGDVRERSLARLAGSTHHLHIGWAAGHPFNNLIRNPFGPGNPFVTIGVNTPNHYDAIDEFVAALYAPAAPIAVVNQPISPSALRIGLHPFASQSSKLWLDAAWRQLAQSLLARGHEVTAFGAPSDLPQLLRLFPQGEYGLRLFAGTLPEFDDALKGLDLMIGLDSFSIHMAQRHRVKSIMLNAGNPANLWVPPNGIVLGHGGGCSRYPCYNVPRCEPGKPFVCVRSISVDQILAQVSRR